MDKTVFCNALAAMAVPVVPEAPLAARTMLKGPLESGASSWPLFAFVGVAVVGAVAAIIWELRSD